MARKKLEGILQKEVSDLSMRQQNQAEIIIEILEKEINYEVLFDEESDTENNEISKIIEWEIKLS